MGLISALKGTPVLGQSYEISYEQAHYFRKKSSLTPKYFYLYRILYQPKHEESPYYQEAVFDEANDLRFCFFKLL